jgi:hypothetical protein
MKLSLLALVVFEFIGWDKPEHPGTCHVGNYHHAIQFNISILIMSYRQRDMALRARSAVGLKRARRGK